MKKREIIKKTKDFTRIIKKRNGIANTSFIVDIEENKDNKTLFGITFVHNIGNAVLRNKLKRKTKAIIDNNKNIYQKNLNYIIIIRKEATNRTYQQLEKDLITLLQKVKEKTNEAK